MSDAFPTISTETRAEWERLQHSDAAGASQFYFERILPAVLTYHRRSTPPSVPWNLLISLMGFSPETTVLVTTILQPQQLLIVASPNTERYVKQCITFLTDHAIISPDRISVRIVDPTDHDAIFAAIGDALAAAKGFRIVDLTGGKKIMSAVAGYAAWSIGLPVCYLESRAYNEQMRRPEPGSEVLIILKPPVQARP